MHNSRPPITIILGSDQWSVNRCINDTTVIILFLSITNIVHVLFPICLNVRTSLESIVAYQVLYTPTHRPKDLLQHMSWIVVILVGAAGRITFCVAEDEEVISGNAASNTKKWLRARRTGENASAERTRRRRLSWRVKGRGGATNGWGLPLPAPPVY